MGRADFPGQLICTGWWIAWAIRSSGHFVVDANVEDQQRVGRSRPGKGGEEETWERREESLGNGTSSSCLGNSAGDGLVESLFP